MATKINNSDRARLRALGERVAELANRGSEKAKTQAWFAHNALEPGRPLVFCDPENGWNEIVTQPDLHCEEQWARDLEWWLLRELFWAEQMRDDRVVTGEVAVGYVHADSGWGMHESRIGGEHGGAYTWEAPVKDLNDLSGLRFPEVTVDREASDRLFDRTSELFCGVLKVVRHQTWLWSVGLTQAYVFLRGLEQMLLDMTQDPDGMRRLMRFLCDGTRSRMRQIEEQGALHLNNRGHYVGSGGFGWTNELPAEGFEGKVRVGDLWGMAESQETVGVSPAMFGELVFPYQLELISEFGLACYGCCEPIQDRWSYISQIPHLRRVSVSPWCDVAAMADNLRGRAILSLKPNPAPLAHPHFDEELVRSELREKLERARGCVVEIIMKDCHTIGGDPNRVVRWVEIAREEAERFAETT